jgi:catechol 2,3-dioxygenase-like lactoylglutathione lyase family enzyme
VTGFNHATVRVADLERSLRFYRDTLGMRPAYVGPGEAHLEWGSAWVCLLEGAEPGAAVPEAAPRLDHLAFAISERDFDAAVEVLRAAGVRIVRGPVERGGGMTVNFLDPDGTELELHTGDLRRRLEVWRETGYIMGGDSQTRQEGR